MIEIMNAEKMRELLADTTYIATLIINVGYRQFSKFLEHTYFKPGSPKNVEFEIIMAHSTRFPNTILTWFRILDTKENREILRQALSKFLGFQLVEPEIFDKRIELLKRDTMLMGKMLYPLESSFKSSRDKALMG